MELVIRWAPSGPSTQDLLKLRQYVEGPHRETSLSELMRLVAGKSAWPLGTHPRFFARELVARAALRGITAEFADPQEPTSEPRVIDTAPFGRLVLNRKNGRLRGLVQLAGRAIEFLIDDLPPALVFAGALAADIVRIDASARRYAALQLCAVRNEGWLEPGEATISVEAFAARLKVASASVASDRAQLWYEDDDLFSGHTICVELDADGAPIAADFHG